MNPFSFVYTGETRAVERRLRRDLGYTQWRVANYSRPTIKEAIISLEIAELPTELLQKLEAIGDVVKPDYPVKNLVRETKVELQVGAETAVDKTERDILHQFSTVDQRRMFRAGLAGFSFHQVAPYETWEPFRTEARRLWDVYHKVVEAFPIQMGVRFVNRLPLPLGEDLGIYLQTQLTLGKDLPQTLAQLFVRATIPYRDRVTLILHQAFLPAQDDVAEGLANVILDLDLRYSLPSIKSDEELWENVEAARADKNAVFEACITQAMRERMGHPCQ